MGKKIRDCENKKISFRTRSAVKARQRAGFLVSSIYFDKKDIAVLCYFNGLRRDFIKKSD